MLHIQTSTSAKFSKVTLADQVYEHVKSWILDNRFSVNENLPVDEIAAALGVSRQPVMSAIQRLSHEGFLVVVPQVGCRIRTYNNEEVKNFFELFACGEAIIARLAATKISQEAIEKLRYINSKIITGCAIKDSDESNRIYRSLNRQFHLEIRQAADSAALTEVVENLGDRSDFFIVTRGRSFATRFESSYEEHERLIDALSKGKEKLAAEIAHQHIMAFA